MPLYFFYKTQSDSNKVRVCGKSWFHHTQPLKLYKLLQVPGEENKHWKHAMGTGIPKQGLISHHWNITYCSTANYPGQIPKREGPGFKSMLSLMVTVILSSCNS